MNEEGGGASLAYVIGLMCGTSGDGITAAAVKWPDGGDEPEPPPVVAAHRTFPWEPALRSRLFALYPPGRFSGEELLCVHEAVGGALAQAAVRLIEQAGIDRRQVRLVSMQGPVLFYDPARGVLEVGNPARVAAALGVAVVSQLRANDMALGGRGAPLTAWFDWWMLGRRPVGGVPVGRVVENLGGIANVTVLYGGAGPESVLAFDVGPGNMVIDGVVRRLTGGAEWMDTCGRRARAGRVCEPLLQELLAHPYFAQPPPKTTGREAFGEPFVNRLMERAAELGVGGDHLVATVTALTAAATRHALERFIWPRGAVEELVLCGGGARNPALVDELARRAAPMRVRLYDDLGVPAEAREAVAWAVMGAFSVLSGRPVTLPAVTGASRAVRLGFLVRPT